MDNGNCRSLEAFILGALINAADMHSQCCHENVDWAPFYAKSIAAQLRPILCAIQAVQPTPIAHVKAHFVNYPNPASVGAKYANRRK